MPKSCVFYVKFSQMYQEWTTLKPQRYERTTHRTRLHAEHRPKILNCSKMNSRGDPSDETLDGHLSTSTNDERKKHS
uniref:Uncharacterized protein n=1 Tax=Oryzias latipes TaxID=8090 RepID=A0A3P9HQW1_ORYLA